MDTKNIIISKAVVNDADVIAALVNSVYRGDNAKKGWTTEADILTGVRITPEKVREILADESKVMFKAVDSDVMIGCVLLENIQNHTMLGMLSVDVNYQSKGIGKILINECERFTKEDLKLSEIRMKVISIRSELIEYYKRRGYLLTGRREDFGTKGDTFGETKLKLYFDELAKKL